MKKKTVLICGRGSLQQNQSTEIKLSWLNCGRLCTFPKNPRQFGKTNKQTTTDDDRGRSTMTDNDLIYDSTNIKNIKNKQSGRPTTTDDDRRRPTTIDDNRRRPTTTDDDTDIKVSKTSSSPASRRGLPAPQDSWGGSPCERTAVAAVGSPLSSLESQLL